MSNIGAVKTNGRRLKIAEALGRVMIDTLLCFWVLFNLFYSLSLFFFTPLCLRPPNHMTACPCLLNIDSNLTMTMEGKWTPQYDGRTDSSWFRTSVAIAGKDFCVIAADTRQSTGYSINSRTSPKAYVLSDTSVIAMNGFHADGLTLKKVLEQRLKVRPHQTLDRLLIDFGFYSGTSSLTIRKCRAMPWPKCFPTPCTNDDSSLTMRSVSWVVWMKKVSPSRPNPAVFCNPSFYDRWRRCVLLRCHWFLRTWISSCFWICLGFDPTLPW